MSYQDETLVVGSSREGLRLPLSFLNLLKSNTNQALLRFSQKSGKQSVVIPLPSSTFSHRETAIVSSSNTARTIYN